MAPENHKWEATRIVTLAGVIVILALQMRLTGTLHRRPANAATSFDKLTQVPTIPSRPAVPASDAAALDPARPVATQPSDPSEITVGPSGISNRYKLRNVERKKQPARDVLVVSLHIESLATEGLVSPFESDMLEINSPGMPAIKPSTPFRSPVPSGNSRDQDIAFSVPSTLSLDHASLRIHYYNYEREIPLDSSLRKDSH